MRHVRRREGVQPRLRLQPLRTCDRDLTARQDARRAQVRVVAHVARVHQDSLRLRTISPHAVLSARALVLVALEPRSACPTFGLLCLLCLLCAPEL